MYAYICINVCVSRAVATLFRQNSLFLILNLVGIFALLVRLLSTHVDRLPDNTT